MRSVNCNLLLTAASALIFASCVSSGKFHAMVRQAHLSDSLYTQSMRTLNACQEENKQLASQKSTLQEQNRDMTQQVTAANEVNGQLRKQMEQLAAVSSAQAESIKRSLDNMGAKDNYMIALHSAITSRDSVNIAVLFQLKQAIGGYGEPSVIIKLEKGSVHVDLSDSLLFNGDSTAYTVSEKAKQVLGRMARVLNGQSDIDVIVESRIDSGMLPSAGTTDSSMFLQRTAPDSTMFLQPGAPDSSMLPQRTAPDNWDLSLHRATAVVRIFQNDYHLAPARMTAAGSFGSFASPSADTTQMPSANRWTRVTILPRIDRLTQLLEHGPGQAPPPPPAAPSADAGKS
jgi:chemotaxis protein MotB